MLGALCMFVENTIMTFVTKGGQDERDYCKDGGTLSKAHTPVLDTKNCHQSLLEPQPTNAVSLR